jgi:hypothetical protein
MDNYTEAVFSMGFLNPHWGGFVVETASGPLGKDEF